MDADLIDLLDRTSIDPHEPVDTRRLREAARRRTGIRRSATAAGVVIAAIAVVPTGIDLFDRVTAGLQDAVVIVEHPGQPVSFDVRLREPGQWTVPTSQTEAEALRDGVPVAMALVPTEVRVPDRGPSLAAGDGLTWKLGPGGRSIAALTPDCGGGQLCGNQYSEFMLVDGNGEIVLAHGLPHIAGTGSFHVTDAGDLVGYSEPTGTSGDTIAYRFGTTPGDRTVVVYPAGGSPFLPGQDTRWPLSTEGEPLVLPDGWQVLPEGTPIPDVLVPGRGADGDGDEMEGLLKGLSS